LDPLGRPILSIANRAAVLDQPFEPHDTKAVDSDVSLGATSDGGQGTQSGRSGPPEHSILGPSFRCANAFLNYLQCDLNR
jgi:hypothetical protein